MTPRLRMLLIHGLGNSSSWWDPFLPLLRRLGVEPQALTLPSLATAGPEAWVRQVLDCRQDAPTMLMGHSLGAATALHAALAARFEAVFLLAMPACGGNRLPQQPEDSTLSLSSLAEIAVFLRAAARRGHGLNAETLHLVGEADPYVDLAAVAELPFPLYRIARGDHELNRSRRAVRDIVSAIARSTCAARHLDPGLRYTSLTPVPPHPATALMLDEWAPSPARLDVEVTRRCQAACRLCARTLRRPAAAEDMEPDTLRGILTECPHVADLVLVGLGEPLLHPRLADFVDMAAQRGIRTNLVTNGLGATPGVLARLQDAGLNQVTFSIDSTDPQQFAALRGGLPLTDVLANLRRVPPTLARAIFVTLSQHNAGALPGIIDLAADLGLPGIGVTDANFAENRAVTLSGTDSAGLLAAAIRHAERRHVVLLSPHFHNLGNMPGPHPRVRVLCPADVSGRAARHEHCLAPWRTAAIGVDGGLAPCNCAPDVSVRPSAAPFRQRWNGPQMRAWRRAMRENTCPACQGCPRY